MGKKKVLLILVVALVVLLGGASALYTQLGDATAPEQLATEQTQPSGESQAEQLVAPDFTVYGADGEAVKLSDHFGKPIVLNFWASWCGPCQSEMPDFQEKYLQLEGSVQFLMVNTTDGSRETVDTAAAFIAQRGYTFPVFYDTQYEASNAYSTYSLPTTYFIDARGYVIARAVGAINTETLQKGIDMITEK